MRKFVVVVGIISVVINVVLAIVSFCFRDIVSGFSPMFNAIYSAVFLAWICSIDDKANTSSYYVNKQTEKINELVRSFNAAENSQNNLLKEIQELKNQIAYLSGQQSTGKETQDK